MTHYFTTMLHNIIILTELLHRKPSINTNIDDF